MDQKKITLSPQDIAKMDKDEFAALLLKALKVEATFVVRDKDGNVRYDDPSLAGTYHEENLPFATKREGQS